MARYDRIAPLPAPARENAFPGWLVLRDIESSDRDTDASRRARLRFLAIRPVLRLIDRGLNTVGRESFARQVEAARVELGYLPARDIERARISRFLHQIESRDAVQLIIAALDMAELCAVAGQTFGAEEFALTGLRIATAADEAQLRGSAHTKLARIYRMRMSWPEAEANAAAAAQIAEQRGEHIELVNARAEAALIEAARGNGAAATAILDRTLAQMRAARDTQAEAITEARFAACVLLLGDAVSCVEHGWNALRQLDEARERAAALETVGTAFQKLGLHKAAERCFTIVTQRGVDPALRARARAAQAVEAAAAGAAASFRERRTALLNDAAEWAADPRISAFVNVELGRGCVICGDIDDARDHVRNAIAIARRHAIADVLGAAEEVLTALEQNTSTHLVAATGTGAAADAARRIADQVEALPDLSVAFAGT